MANEVKRRALEYLKILLTRPDVYELIKITSILFINVLRAHVRLEGVLLISST